MVEIKKATKINQDEIDRIRVDYKIYGKILFMSLSFYIATQFFEDYIEAYLGTRASNKPYKSFSNFYPFYLTQHTDYYCKFLHFIGTSIVLNIVIFNLVTLLQLIPAYFIGNSIRIVTTNLDHGVYEGLAMILFFLYLSKLLTHNISRSAMILIVGYGFAWVGHFFYEKNRPATFIYPTYSLMGDFYLWYEIASGARKF